MSSFTTVTLSSEYYTFNGDNGYIHPGDSNTSWWTLGDTTNGYVEIDPGVTIRVRSVEARALGDHWIKVHKDLAEVACLVQECRDFDTDYYNFTITNLCPQGVKLEFDDPIAYIIA